MRNILISFLAYACIIITCRDETSTYAVRRACLSCRCVTQTPWNECCLSNERNQRRIERIRDGDRPRERKTNNNNTSMTSKFGGGGSANSECMPLRTAFYFDAPKFISIDLIAIFWLFVMMRNSIVIERNNERPIRELIIH